MNRSSIAWRSLLPGFDIETDTSAVKVAASADLEVTRDIMQRIYDEDPSYWPHGLTPEHCDGGTYLIRKAADFSPVGFAGWQEREREGKRIGYYAVGILPEYRGQHFAKRAVAKLIQAKAAGVDEVRAYIMPHNTPSIGLATALGIPVVYKSAGIKALLAKAVGKLGKGVKAFGTGSNSGAQAARWGLGNAAVWDAFNNRNDYTNTEHMGDRLGNAALNALIGVGAGAAHGFNPLARTAQSLGAGVTTAGMTPIKDLVVGGIGLLPDARKALQSVGAGRSSIAPQITVNPGATNVNVKGSGGGAGIDPKILWGGLGLAGILGGAGLLNSHRQSKAITEIANRQDNGKLRVTLPTKGPDDNETSIELPMDQINLSQTLEQALKRDVKRRLRSESNGRTWRRHVVPGTVLPA